MIRFPGDPQTWYRLAAFQLGTLDAPEQALETLKGRSTSTRTRSPAAALFLDARARLREKTGSEPSRTSTSSAGEQRPGAALERAHVEAELVEQRARASARVRKRRCGESGSGRPHERRGWPAW